MATNVLEICNAALSKLGAEPITSLDGTSKGAISCKARYGACKKIVLRKHPWNCAIKRVKKAISDKLTFDGLIFNKVSGSDVWQNSVDINIVIQRDTWDGSEVWVYDDSPGAGILYINSSGSSVPPLTGWVSVGGPGAMVVAYTGNDSTPEFEYSYGFLLPTDCLRLLTVNDSPDDFTLEGRTILTNDTTLEIKYIYNVGSDTDGTSTTVSVFDELLVEAVACYLAWDICYKIVQSTTLKQLMWSDFEEALRKAKSADAQEGPSAELGADYYLEARLGGTNSIEPKRNW
jgi:hypothetical protein